MHFLEIDVTSKQLMWIVRSIPEDWWRTPFNDISCLAGLLHDSQADRLEHYAQAISNAIAQTWLRDKMRKAGNTARVPLLVNCVVSERVVTISIPTSFGPGESSFYNIQFSPSGKLFKLSLFHPKGQTWYGRLVSRMVYDMDMGLVRAKADGEDVSLKALNAILALDAAHAAEVGILWDMARDGVI